MQEEQKNLKPKVGIGLLIFKEGKLLFGKRKNIHGAGEYAGPGGHLEYMESIEACAKRETSEETGLEIENIKFLCLVNLKEYAPAHYINIGLTADWKSGELENREPNKLVNWDWYDMDNLPSPFFAMYASYFEALKGGAKFWDN